MEKTVTIPARKLEEMLRHPMCNHEAIVENAGVMGVDGDGVYHCLLVTGEGRADGLLVESEGSGSARSSWDIWGISWTPPPAARCSAASFISQGKRQKGISAREIICPATWRPEGASMISPKCPRRAYWKIFRMQDRGKRPSNPCERVGLFFSDA